MNAVRPLYPSLAAYHAATRAAIVRQGLTPIKAKEDHAGNCVVCDEAGRCPGWHAEPEVLAALRNQAQFFTTVARHTVLSGPTAAQNLAENQLYADARDLAATLASEPVDLAACLAAWADSRRRCQRAIEAAREQQANRATARAEYAQLSLFPEPEPATLF